VRMENYCEVEEAKASGQSSNGESSGNGCWRSESWLGPLPHRESVPITNNHASTDERGGNEDRTC
jgi:hypothetical protein